MEYQTQSENPQGQSSLGQLQPIDKKQKYRQLAWWCGLGPILLFILTVYFWGLLQLFTTSSNYQTAFFQFSNQTLVPSLIVIESIAFPIGIILAIYFGIKATRASSNPNVIKSKRNWWKIVGITALVVLILIIIPALSVWLVTSHYNKTNCGFAGCSLDPDVLPNIPNTLDVPSRVPAVELREANKAEARDALGEATLANLRSRAEFYAFNKLDISYEGWCDAIEDTPPGLVVGKCVDAEDSWALSARTTGTNQLKCVDSENDIVDGVVSIESGLCEQGEIQVVITSSGSGENQVTTKSNLSAQEIERIANESIEKINEVANSLDGIELQIVTAIPNLEPGETKEWQGMTFEPVGDYPVIMVTGTATTRSDLAGGVYPYSKSFLNVLMNVPNFDTLLPTNTLTQADDIEFQMVVVLTGE